MFRTSELAGLLGVDRSFLHYYDKAGIIATGGYDLSKEMMEEHSPDPADTFALSSAGNKGDGIKIAEAVAQRRIIPAASSASR